jgi:hypothetical protein
MAIRGAKPKPTAVKDVLGNPGRRAVRRLTNQPPAASKPSPPVKLTGRPAALWRRYIRTAWWLEYHDSPKAWLWCQLHAEAEANVAGFTAARLAQLRSLGSELGLDVASRSRMGSDRPPPDAQPDPYF